MASSIVTLPKDLEDVTTSVLVTPGVYDYEVDKYEVKVGGKAQYVNITARILDGEFQGQPVFIMLSLSENALWKFKRFLLAIGAKSPKGTKIDLNKLLKKQFSGDLIHEEYDPGDGSDKRTVNRISDFFAIGTKKAETGAGVSATTGKGVKVEDAKEDDAEVVF